MNRQSDDRAASAEAASEVSQQGNEARRTWTRLAIPLAGVVCFAIALVIYILAYTAVTGAGVPIALLMTLSGGFLFGPWLGGAAQRNPGSTVRWNPGSLDPGSASGRLSLRSLAHS